MTGKFTVEVRFRYFLKVFLRVSESQIKNECDFWEEIYSKLSCKIMPNVQKPVWKSINVKNIFVYDWVLSKNLFPVAPCPKNSKREVTLEPYLSIQFMTKFKWNQNVSRSGPPTSLIPILRNIGILQYKQAKLRKHLQHSAVYI